LRGEAQKKKEVGDLAEEIDWQAFPESYFLVLRPG
jgi:hypothetical protein